MPWGGDYITAADLKAYLHITDTNDDAQIALAVTAASRAVDRAANRQFGLVAAPELRYYTARWDRGCCRYVVDIDDLMTQTGLEVESGGTGVTDFSVRPSNAAAMGVPWTQIVFDPNASVSLYEDGVEVTARWGWASVPTPIKQAVTLQASRLFTRRNAPFGVAGSPELGSELRLLAKLDPDVEVTIGPYKRWWAAA